MGRRRSVECGRVKKVEGAGMRLINADSLVLNGWFLVRVNNDGCSVGFETQHLNVTPTAYDIDKVVKQLEEIFDKWGLDNGKKEIMREIVKKGGAV